MRMLNTANPLGRILRVVGGSKSQCDRGEPIRQRVLSQVIVLARHARIKDRDAFDELYKQVLRRDDAITMLARDIEL